MRTMFAKVFTQIFESTIAEDYKVRHVFMDLLVMADSDGVIDKTPESIARIANVPLEEINYGIQALLAPDPKSRTDSEDGRRLIPLEPNRSWGWRIVNYEKYREIRDEEARRIANRTYKRMQRQRQKLSANVSTVSSTVSNVSTGQPMSAHAEAEAEAEVLVLDPGKSLEEPKSSTGGKSVREKFRAPTREEAWEFCKEAQIKIDANGWFDYYEANGWKVGRNPMKDWKACMRYWARSGGINSNGRHEANGPELTKAQQRVVNNRNAILTGFGISPPARRDESTVQDGSDASRSEDLETRFLKGKT